jgi:hypothetical protein
MRVLELGTLDALERARVADRADQGAPPGLAGSRAITESVAGVG